MNWFKKHADAVMVMAVVVGSVVWIHEKMDSRFTEIEKDLAVIKAVLVMKNILPVELAAKE